MDALQAASPLPVVWGVDRHRDYSRETQFTVCPNLLKLRLARWGKLQRLLSSKTGITALKKPAGDTTRVSREDIILEIHNT
jgi:hypothetical protein